MLAQPLVVMAILRVASEFRPAFSLFGEVSRSGALLFPELILHRIKTLFPLITATRARTLWPIPFLNTASR
jgi:hypothetical protein